MSDDPDRRPASGVPILAAAVGLVLIPLATNLASNAVPASWRPYGWIAWPVLGGLFLLQLWLDRRHRDGSPLVAPPPPVAAVRGLVTAALVTAVIVLTAELALNLAAPDNAPGGEILMLGLAAGTLALAESAVRGRLASGLIGAVVICVAGGSRC